MTTENIDVTEATPFTKNSTRVWVKFENGRSKLVDFAQLIPHNTPMYEALFRQGKFGTLTVNKESGTVTWDNGTWDIAPETLYKAPDVRASEYIFAR